MADLDIFTKVFLNLTQTLSNSPINTTKYEIHIGGGMEEEISIVGERGQVVIPKELRTKLGLKPRTKVLVIRRGDSVVMRKLNLQQERRELEKIFRRVDERVKRYGRLTEREIDQLIHSYRAEIAREGG